MLISYGYQLILIWRPHSSWWDNFYSKWEKVSEFYSKWETVQFIFFDNDKPSEYNNFYSKWEKVSEFY